MHVNLGPEIEKYIQSKIDTGFYANATEVLRDALRQMRERDEPRYNPRLHALLQQGIDSLERDGGIPHTPELMDKLMEEGFAAAKAGVKPRPEVCPED